MKFTNLNKVVKGDSFNTDKWQRKNSNYTGVREQNVQQNYKVEKGQTPSPQAVLRIRIRIRIYMLLGLPDPDPDPFVRGMDPDPDPFIVKKNSKKNLDF